MWHCVHIPTPGNSSTYKLRSFTFCSSELEITESITFRFIRLLLVSNKSIIALYSVFILVAFSVSIHLTLCQNLERSQSVTVQHQIWTYKQTLVQTCWGLHYMQKTQPGIFNKCSFYPVANNNSFLIQIVFSRSFKVLCLRKFLSELDGM